MKERVFVYEEATMSISCVQIHYKEQSDVHQREIVFQVGERVLLCLLPHPIHPKLSSKLAPTLFTAISLKMQLGLPVIGVSYTNSHDLKNYGEIKTN